MENVHGGQQSRIDRMHPRDRGRQQIGPGPLRSRPFQMEKSRVLFYIVYYVKNISLCLTV